MFTRKCRCGKSEKNFKVDIGPFFINECCMDAGYDKMGNKAEKEIPAPKPVKEEPVVTETAPVVEEPMAVETKPAESKPKRSKKSRK